MKRAFLVLCVVTLFATTAQAEILITEYMYDGFNGEFIEFTNLGASNVDMTGWSFDDDSRSPGTVSLSAFGTVAPGESVILSEKSSTNFHNYWGLASTVKVIGSNKTNLGVSDEINLYAPGATSETPEDRLTFGGTTGSPLTLNFSANPGSPSVLGTNNAAGWVPSTPRLANSFAPASRLRWCESVSRVET